MVPEIIIGKYIISEYGEDNVWISVVGDGEGGEFLKADLELLIEKLYREKF